MDPEVEIDKGGMIIGLCRVAIVIEAIEVIEVEAIEEGGDHRREEVVVVEVAATSADLRTDAGILTMVPYFSDLTKRNKTLWKRDAEGDWHGSQNLMFFPPRNKRLLMLLWWHCPILLRPTSQESMPLIVTFPPFHSKHVTPEGYTLDNSLPT